MINFAISGNFYGLCTTWPWMQRYLKRLNMTLCSATPAPGSCFYYDSGFTSNVPMAVCFWIFVSSWVCLVPQWSNTAAWSVCRPGGRLQRGPPLSQGLVLSLPRAVSPLETWECAHPRLCILFQIQKLCSQGSTKITDFTSYCVFSRVSEIPGSGYSSSACRIYLDA